MYLAIHTGWLFAFLGWGYETTQDDFRENRLTCQYRADKLTSCLR
jgi:hypothetical protein